MYDRQEMESAAESRGVPLSRERVLHASVTLADRDGIEALTMRKLAEALGAGTMSLYHYFASRDELVGAMVDLVYGEIEGPPDEADWKAALRRVEISTHAALTRHPWAVPLMESTTNPGPENLRHHNAVMGRLREAGFSIRLAIRAFSALDSYVYGFALQQQSMPFDTPEEFLEVAESLGRQVSAEEHPYLAETIVELASGFDYGEEFEKGLDLILDAVERLVTTE